jgi:hypothetical protein
LIDDTLARGAGKMQLIHRLVDGALARARFKHAHSTALPRGACTTTLPAAAGELSELLQDLECKLDSARRWTASRSRIVTLFVSEGVENEREAEERPGERGDGSEAKSSEAAT